LTPESKNLLPEGGSVSRAEALASALLRYKQASQRLAAGLGGPPSGRAKPL
jgi:hypothetical protein